MMKKDQREWPTKESIKSGEYSLASASGLTYVAQRQLMISLKLQGMQMIVRKVKDALVAQLDRALDYESRGREFESSRARHFPSSKVLGPRYK